MTQTLHTVTSRDGTRIGYRRLGEGPGLVVLHGAMESSASHRELAEALADGFTVCLPDRRGRGRSGPYGKVHCLQRDVEDLEALLAATGAQRVFGVSSGAIIALQGALTLPSVRQAGIFEPPLSFDIAEARAVLARFDAELTEGRIAAALVTGMKAARMGPRIFNVLPRWLLERLTTALMASEEKRATADEVTMRALAPTLREDFGLVVETVGTLSGFGAIPAQVLLLGGSASPAYLKAALDALAKTLPGARRVELRGAGHGASGNRNRGGQPERTAEVLRDFFTEQGA